MGNKHSSTRNARGFTLIEIVVVLVLAGILAAMAGFGIVQAVQGYMFTRENAAITEKAQLAMSRITREIVEMTDLDDDADSTSLPVYSPRGSHVLGFSSEADAVMIDDDILIDNVVVFDLAYHLADGTSQAELEQIDLGLLSAIDITLEVERSDGSGTMLFTNRVAPRNIGLKRVAGDPSAPASAPPAAPNYNICFVATAAWGDGAHPMVVLLRDFRDHFLMTWSGGRRLVDLYYLHGAAAANLIQDRPAAMWVVRVVLAPVAAVTFMVLYAPLIIPFILFVSVILTMTLIAAVRRKTGKATSLSPAGQKGGILIGLIVTMVIMSALGAAVLPLFSSSQMTQVYADASRKTYFLAESGYRFAASEFLNAASESAKLTTLNDMDGRTYNLLDNNGSFNLRVYPYWFKAQAASGGDTAVTATVYGTLPQEFDGSFAGGEISVGNKILSYDNGSGSGSTVTFNLSSDLDSAISDDADIVTVARPSSSQTFSKGDNIVLDSTGTGRFPEVNGIFILQPSVPGFAGSVFMYEKRSGNVLQGIALADTEENASWTSNVSVDENTAVVLDKYLKLSSTGTIGGYSREIMYNVPIGWVAGGEGGKFRKEQYHDTFGSDANWFTDESLGGHSVSGGVMQVTEMQTTPPDSAPGGVLGAIVSWLSGAGGQWAAVAFDWSNVNTNLAQSWMDAGGCLSYDIQAKVNTPAPYFFAGLGFRMRNNEDDSDLYTYGVSFIRQRQIRNWFFFSPSNWSDNDGINPALRPFSSYSSGQFIAGSVFLGTQARYSDPGIILWQRTGPPDGPGTFQLLGHKTIVPGDGLTTGTGPDLRLNPWSTLMVRLTEGYELEFNQGRVDENGRHLKYGDMITSEDGSKKARIIGTPITTTSWGVSNSFDGAGTMLLTNVAGGGFSSNDNLYLSGGDAVAYARADSDQAASKTNYIMVYFSDDKEPVAGNTVQTDNTRIGNQWEHVNWPPDDWTDRAGGLPTATPPGNDYFTLVQWFPGPQIVPSISRENWSTGNGWSISGDELRKDSNGTETAQPRDSLFIMTGTTYDVTFTVSNHTRGGFNYTLGGVSGSAVSANGTYTTVITATSSGNLVFTPTTNNSRFRITNISVIGRDTLNRGEANYVSALGGTDFYQAVVKTGALLSPDWDGEITDFLDRGDHIALFTSSSAGTLTQYDDFGIQLDQKAGTGFLPPIQQ
ncbi:MAG: hypothetical protein AVO39_01825 [delta proteobacterium MLS_D]|jgi:prepilin-type N-terminal cleavage/methylation domain-containing protein|nr:MAG: hypothetical protein AVO39_01825 [delta proteobacterium MLS_D]